jgi:hypothetical protein
MESAECIDRFQKNGGTTDFADFTDFEISKELADLPSA